MAPTTRRQQDAVTKSTKNPRTSTSTAAGVGAAAAATTRTGGAKRKAPPPGNSNNESKTPNQRKRSKIATEIPPSKFSFYAMRAGSISKEPVIFFGMNDFHMFVRWASQEKGIKTNANKKNAKSSWTYDYKIFDNILDAYQYAIGDEWTSDTKTATSPSFASPIRATATSIRRLSLSTAAAIAGTQQQNPFGQDKPNTWEEYIELLKEYKEAFGDCYVPYDPIPGTIPEKYRCLGLWVRNQRNKYRKFESIVQQQQEEAAKSSEKNDGDATPATPVLATSTRKGAMTLEQYEQLRDLGLCGPRAPPPPAPSADTRENETSQKHKEKEEIWNKHFKLLKQYKKKFGDCYVPIDPIPGTIPEKFRCLGPWVSNQRNKYRKFESMKQQHEEAAKSSEENDGDATPTTPVLATSTRPGAMTLEQYEQLRDLGILGPRASSLVSTGSKAGAKVKKEKQRYGKSVSSGLANQPARSKESLDPLQDWNEKFQLLQEYKEDYGDCWVQDWKPSGSLPEKYRGLASWVRTQRKNVKLFEEDPSKLGSRILMTEELHKKLMDLGLNDEKVSLTEKEEERLSIWDDQFELLEEYKDEYGDCWVPDWTPRGKLPEKYRGLASWVRTQRKNIKIFEEDPSKINARMVMTEEHRQKLLDLGLNDEKKLIVRVEKNNIDTWNERFELLKEYKEGYGDCWVPDWTLNGSLPEKYRGLASWVRTQRRHAKTYEEDPSKLGARVLMTEELHKKLMDIGLNDEKVNCAEKDDEKVNYWNERFELLKEYRKEYGDCWVPDWSEKGILPEKYRGLASWVRTQRKHVRTYEEDPSKISTRVVMTKELYDKLMDVGLNDIKNTVGFKIPVNDETKLDRWDKIYELLKEYKEEFGDCFLPTTPDDKIFPDKYRPLIPKMRGIRNAFDEFGKDPSKLSHSFMNAERYKKLEELGFASSSASHNQTGYRKRLREHIYDENFKKKFEELKAFNAKHGHINPKGSSPLGVWIWQQKQNYQDMHEGKETFMKMDHVVQLNSIGFDFSKSTNKRAKDRMKEYVEFVKTHGKHPNHLSKVEAERRLGLAANAWRHRYKLMKKGILKEDTPRKLRLGKYISQEQIDALSEVGFRWEFKFEKKVKRKKKKRILTWEEKFELLKDYKKRHGHCEPTYTHPKLGVFCHQQRQQYKCMKEGLSTNLTMERFQKLSELGFRFKTAGENNKRKRYVDGSKSDTSESESSDDEEDDNENEDENENEDGQDDEDEYDSENENGDDESIGSEKDNDVMATSSAVAAAAAASSVPAPAVGNAAFATPPSNNVASIPNRNWMVQGMFPNDNNNNANAMSTNHNQMIQDMQTRLWAMGKAPRFN